MSRPIILEALVALVLVMFALMSGFFYAYTVSVMPGLDSIEPIHAIRAMQGINDKVRNPTFFITYFLTPGVALIVALVLRRSGLVHPSNLLLLASFIYLSGVLLPTGAVNVPMNEALARAVVPTDIGQAREMWTSYSAPWATWNTLRTGFSALSLLAAGLCLARLAKSVGTKSRFEPDRAILSSSGALSNDRSDVVESIAAATNQSEETQSH
jgi:uncharacterized membrane protein